MRLRRWRGGRRGLIASSARPDARDVGQHVPGIGEQGEAVAESGSDQLRHEDRAASGPGPRQGAIGETRSVMASWCVRASGPWVASAAVAAGAVRSRRCG